ncbi:hypothetical protein V496_04043 [Pseudogymnoascus sp. VKM F-4515 (FW-2607)]|nr:hypothetical protein V496_04043 [Pseudogymnoascus sp. VKM F-4515 (FW-2607)]
MVKLKTGFFNWSKIRAARAINSDPELKLKGRSTNRVRRPSSYLSTFGLEFEWARDMRSPVAVIAAR